MTNEFPEIANIKSEREARLAYHMGLNNLSSVTEEFKPELLRRLDALQARRKELLHGIKLKVIKPERGKVYKINHSSGKIQARFINETAGGFRTTRTHYIFQNLGTGRDIRIKSTRKIIREVI